jgi:hypothetical protein
MTSNIVFINTNGHWLLKLFSASSIVSFILIGGAGRIERSDASPFSPLLRGPLIDMETKLEPDTLHVELQHGPYSVCGRLIHDHSRLEKLKKELEKLGKCVHVKFVPVGSRIPRLSKPEEHNIVTVEAKYLDPETSQPRAELLYQIPSIRMFDHDGGGARCEEAKSAVNGMLKMLNWY